MNNIVCEIDDAMRMFQAMRYNNIVQKKDVRKVIRQEMVVVQKKMRQMAKESIKQDPRRASQAIKLNIYRDANGALISLFNSRKAGKTVVEGSHSTGGRSGIRRKRNVSADTDRINGYRGKDRAFILRWINNGVSRKKRGAIVARPFFFRAEDEVRKAKDRIVARFSKLVAEVAGQ